MEEICERFTGWAYQLSAGQAANLRKRMADLTKESEPEPESPETPAPAPGNLDSSGSTDASDDQAAAPPS